MAEIHIQAIQRVIQYLHKPSEPRGPDLLLVKFGSPGLKSCESQLQLKFHKISYWWFYFLSLSIYLSCVHPSCWMLNALLATTFLLQWFIMHIIWVTGHFVPKPTQPWLEKYHRTHQPLDTLAPYPQSLRPHSLTVSDSLRGRDYYVFT